jgi:hypothetical protein
MLLYSQRAEIDDGRAFARIAKGLFCDICRRNDMQVAEPR